MPTPAIARTVVPIIVGAILSFFATRGIELNSTYRDALVYVVTGAITAGYYVVLLALETRWPIAGFLLGSTARPTYEGRHRRPALDPTTATSDAPEDQS
ncbi:hypothetical protein [Streptomyces sp. NPDC088727]|uniref:hypothetical protein n=1 Tax=Streptomyces sp. NPDC088727 TaxID=3365875 RepID=UPI003808AEBE